MNSFTIQQCELDLSITVNQNPCPIYIPNVFSPDGDGINDEFKLYLHPDFRGRVVNVSIFDRWGALMYQNTGDLAPAWDGTFKGKRMLPGCYIYFVTVEYEDGTQNILTGEVNIVR